MIITRKPGFFFIPPFLPNLSFWIRSPNIFNGSNPANNTPLDEWMDLSDVTGSALQGTAGKQPVFIENIQNGLPAVQFSAASSQCMQVPSIALGSQMTVFAVLECITGNTWFMEQSPDINTNDGFYMYGNGFATQIKNSGSSVMSQSIAGWLGTDPVLAMTRYDGTFVEVWKNGTNYPGSTGSGSITNNTVTNALNIGSRNQAGLFFDGYLYELIIYNRALSNSEAVLVSNYCNREWALY